MEIPSWANLNALGPWTGLKYLKNLPEKAIIGTVFTNYSTLGFIFPQII